MYDLTRDLRVSVRGNEPFPLASVFKIAVAAVAYRQADRHLLDLDGRVLLTAADLRRGASPIAEAHPRGNASYTYWQLIRAMLVDSDNTACDYLLNAVGGPSAVQKTMLHLGIRGLRIRKSEADLYADARMHRRFARGGDNAGTPDGVADLLRSVATERATLLDSTTELMLDLGDVETGPGRLRAGIPADAALAHKTGTSDTFGSFTDATNDAGVLTLPDGRRVIVVALLAESRADAATRDAVLADVARAVYAVYGP